MFSVALLNDSKVAIKAAACQALGEIGRNGPLPLPPGVELVTGDSDLERKTDQVEESQKLETECKSEEITKLSVVKTLIAMIRTSNESTKVRQLLL